MHGTKLLTIGVLAAAVGCGQPAATRSDAGLLPPATADDDHGHGAGPHGGTVVEFGKFHAEFCVDHGKKQATVYVLSVNLKRAVPVAADKLLLSVNSPRFQADLVADPQDGDPKGKASRFVATDDHLGHEQEFEGTISGVIDGKPYAGDFKEEAHADHTHGKK